MRIFSRAFWSKDTAGLRHTTELATGTEVGEGKKVEPGQVVIEEPPHPWWWWLKPTPITSPFVGSMDGMVANEKRRRADEAAYRAMLDEIAAKTAGAHALIKLKALLRSGDRIRDLDDDALADLMDEVPFMPSRVANSFDYEITRRLSRRRDISDLPDASPAKVPEQPPVGFSGDPMCRSGDEL